MHEVHKRKSNALFLRLREEVLSALDLQVDLARLLGRRERSVGLLLLLRLLLLLLALCALCASLQRWRRKRGKAESEVNKRSHLLRGRNTELIQADQPTKRRPKKGRTSAAAGAAPFLRAFRFRNFGRNRSQLSFASAGSFASSRLIISACAPARRLRLTSDTHAVVPCSVTADDSCVC